MESTLTRVLSNSWCFFCCSTVGKFIEVYHFAHTRPCSWFILNNLNQQNKNCSGNYLLYPEKRLCYIHTLDRQYTRPYQEQYAVYSDIVMSKRGRRCCYFIWLCLSEMLEVVKMIICKVLPKIEVRQKRFGKMVSWYTHSALNKCELNANDVVLHDYIDQYFYFIRTGDKQLSLAYLCLLLRFRWRSPLLRKEAPPTTNISFVQRISSNTTPAPMISTPKQQPPIPSTAPLY